MGKKSGRAPTFHKQLSKDAISSNDTTASHSLVASYFGPTRIHFQQKRRGFCLSAILSQRVLLQIHFRLQRLALRFSRTLKLAAYHSCSGQRHPSRGRIFGLLQFNATDFQFFSALAIMSICSYSLLWPSSYLSGTFMDAILCHGCCLYQ